LKSVSRPVEGTVNSMEKRLESFVKLMSKNSISEYTRQFCTRFDQRTHTNLGSCFSAWRSISPLICLALNRWESCRSLPPVRLPLKQCKRRTRLCALGDAVQRGQFSRKCRNLHENAAICFGIKNGSG